MIAINWLIFVCNVISFLVQVINFAADKVDNFCEQDLNTALFKTFVQKDERFVVFRTK